jgi:hypothetical protein
VRLRVTDDDDQSDTTTVTVTVGAPPTLRILGPTKKRHWVVNDFIRFSGSGKDFNGNDLPPSGLSWKLDLRHCSDATTCHTHPLETFPGVASGSFRTPDHEYPSYLNLTLTATDSSGLSSSRTLRLDPVTVVLSFRSSPSGLRLSVGSGEAATPFSRRVIVGSSNSVTAITPQTQTGTLWRFASWADGGSAGRDIIAPATATTYTARFADTVLLGDPLSRSSTVSGPAGVARAYRTAPAQVSGSLGALNVAVRSTSTAAAIVAGLYADAGGKPGALLASGRLNTPSAGHWNRIPMTSGGASIVAGTRYWIALLAPSGTLQVPATSSGGLVSQHAATGLGALPGSWSSTGESAGGTLSATGILGP